MVMPGGEPELLRQPMLLGFDDLRGVPPTFFVGLGGSGGRVVDVLAQRLQGEPSWKRFQKLIHFICLDTDGGDLARLARRVETSFLGTPQKRRRIQLLRGELDHPENERVTSWVHPWYGFRETSGPGAGQIRIESRFCSWCQMSDGLPKNIRSILSARIRDALNALNPNVQQDAAIRFFFYGSLAGGTGSGAFLPMAYLARRLAEDAGARVEVYGMFFLPSVFRAGQFAELHPKLNANAYAALKELERCMELRFDSGPGRVELVHDPLRTRSSRVSDVDFVDQAPYDFVYLVDLPENIAVDQIYQAAGETAYLQLFSPILGFQERSNNNYEQIQGAADGYFSQQYGSMGAAVIEFPRERLIRYFARCKAIELVEQLVVGRPRVSEGAFGGVALDSREFRELAEVEQSRVLDASFTTFVDQEARAEEQRRRVGIFTQVKSLSSGNANLMDELRARLRQEMDATDSEIVISAINAPAITPDNPSLNHARVNLRRDHDAGKQIVDRRAALLAREIQAGQYFASYFRDFRVSPLQQRYLLVRLNELARNADLRTGNAEEDATLLEWCLIPDEDREGFSFLARKPPDPAEYDVDHPVVRERIRKLEEALERASKLLIGREKAFTLARAAAVREFQRLEQKNQEALIVDFWHQVSRALRQQVDKRLNQFRVIAKKGLGTAEHLRAQAERCRETGAAVPDVGTTTEENVSFHLGNDVFHDARAGVRQWHLVYRLRVRDALTIDTDHILAQVNAVLDAASGAREGVDSDVVLTDIVAAIDRAIVEKTRQLIDVDDRMTLAEGLELEARLTRLGNRESVTLAELRALPEEEITPYLVDKIRRVANMSRPLARFDRPVVAGADIHAYPPQFCGVASAVLERSRVVRDALAAATESFARLEDWESTDILSFYQAMLGLPLYTYLEVRNELRASYEYEVRESGREHPLHIDHRFEEPGFHDAPGPGLPGLSVRERAEWERRVAASERAAREARARASQATAGQLARSLAAGLVRSDATGRYVLAFRGRELPLELDLAGTLGAYAALPDATREPVERAAVEVLAREPERVRACLETLDGSLFDASQDGRGDEVAAIRALMERLRSVGG